MTNQDYNLIENTISSKEILSGSFLHVYRDEVELPTKNTSTREYTRHVGAVCILPIDKDGNIYMEHQYRHPIRKVILEIPAGKLNNKFEDRLEAAKRELKEETGIVAEKWTSIGDYIPAPAYSDERLTIYIAENLHFEDRHLDSDEFIVVEKIPLTSLLRDCMNGKITDGKTLVAVLKAARILHL